MGLRAVSLELLPLALVFRHAVHAAVLELDLAGQNCLQIELKNSSKNIITLYLGSHLAVSFTVSPGQAVVHHSSVGCGQRSIIIATRSHPVGRHPGTLEVVLLCGELYSDLAGVRP